MDRRYQVFVSSTFTDLKDERKAIIENLLNAKYIPAGMEMFSASNDEQFKYIKKIIDNCDYYILIIGARYGSINPTTGISFTEQEYDYAISKKIPVLVFLYGDPYNLPEDKRDDDKREQLRMFREKASNNRLCKIWYTISELIASVIISLGEEVAENPQLGWSRGSTQDVTELLAQLNDLRIEKERADKEISRLKSILQEIYIVTEDLAGGEDKYVITGKSEIIDHKKTIGTPNKEYIDSRIEITWDEIFSLIGPYLYTNLNYSKFKINLTDAIKSRYEKVKFSYIHDDCIQTIKIQLKALGLIDVHNLTDMGFQEFIILTEKGKSHLVKLKAIKRQFKN